MNGTIFDIKHFAIHDGPGIRTTVFMKGCPLKCVWCHNPEGLTKQMQFGYFSHKCVNCGQCTLICKTNAHSLDAGHTHRFERERCIFCGKCIKECINDALIIYGKTVDSETVLKELLEDTDFYEASGGGVTLSGGECLVQADFCRELLSLLKKENIHTAVDTCGFVSYEAIDKVIDYTDLFLYDIKAIDEDIHIKCTGKPNKIILENLRYIDSLGKKSEIRYPYVPGYNSGEAEKIAEFILTLKNTTGIRILGYHNYAAGKYSAVGIKNTLPKTVPDIDAIDKVKSMFEAKGVNVLK